MTDPALYNGFGWIYRYHTFMSLPSEGGFEANASHAAETHRNPETYLSGVTWRVIVELFWSAGRHWTGTHALSADVFLSVLGWARNPGYCVSDVTIIAKKNTSQQADCLHSVRPFCKLFYHLIRVKLLLITALSIHSGACESSKEYIYTLSSIYANTEPCDMSQDLPTWLGYWWND